MLDTNSPTGISNTLQQYKHVGPPRVLRVDGVMPEKERGLGRRGSHHSTHFNSMMSVAGRGLTSYDSFSVMDRVRQKMFDRGALEGALYYDRSAADDE